MLRMAWLISSRILPLMFALIALGKSVAAQETPDSVNLFAACVNGLQVDINGEASPGASVTSISWSWGDETATTGFFPQSHTYLSTGIYTVQVTAHYNDDSTASASQNVNVAPGNLSNCEALTITADEGGSISYQASVGSGTVLAGSSKILELDFENGPLLSANAGIGYSFSSWSVGSGIALIAGSTASPSINIVVSSASSITAKFGESRNVQFSPSTTPETQIATIGDPTDPAAQSLALTLASVTNAINVLVSFFYEPTDVSTGTRGGVGIADGICEAGATEETDFDCRFTEPPPDFTYPAPLLPAGDLLVPHIIPSHNKLGVWVRVTATLVSNGMPAVAGTDYNVNGGFVEWYYAWNANPSLVALLTNYSSGWNNQNEQMYDRPGENVDIAFVANISTFSKSCSSTTCVGTADPGKGGKTKTLNDIVVAAPPNPSGTADKVEPLVPVPGISPFPYLKRLPMLVSFELENGSTDKPDPTALTLPHSVSVAMLDPSGNPIPVQYPAGFPTTFTYNPFLKEYYIYLSPTPYKTDGTVYTMQIDSDLFPQPVNLKFVVKNF